MIGLKLNEIITHILSMLVMTVLRRGSTDISENNLEAVFGELKHLSHYHMKKVNHCMIKIIRSSFLES